jgi:hypothetical protein
MFIFLFLYLFTFCQHKQLPIVAQFFKGYASLEVTQPSEVATDLTFLTGFIYFFIDFVMMMYDYYFTSLLAHLYIGLPLMSNIEAVISRFAIIVNKLKLEKNVLGKG